MQFYGLMLSVEVTHPLALVSIRVLTGGVGGGGGRKAGGGGKAVSGVGSRRASLVWFEVGATTRSSLSLLAAIDTAGGDIGELDLASTS